MNIELWKSVNDYEGFYEVSNYGNIRSVDRYLRTSKGVLRFYKGKILKKILNKDGYCKVTLCKNGVEENKVIHRLVAEVFIPNPDNKPQVNHIGEDGNKTNNYYENLEWATQSENTQHSYDVLKQKSPWFGKFGKDHNTSKPVVQLSLLGAVMRKFDSIHEAEIVTKSRHISCCCRGKRKSAGGFIWQYAN